MGFYCARARQEVILRDIYVPVYHTELSKLIRHGKHAVFNGGLTNYKDERH